MNANCLPGWNLRITLCFAVATLCLALTASAAAAIEFDQKIDLQARADDRSSRSLRYQFRARYYPSITVSEALSAHAFVATGDEFGSSHNTFNDDAADRLYVRRLYLRHEADYGKTEVGVIPTYKGKVSSSGLSKDGWIKGIRYVRNTRPGARFEVVAGQLDSVDPADALDAPTRLNYLEAEYSADLDERTSYEFSVERMTEASFVRTELRRQFGNRYTAFAELVYRLDETARKFVLGAETELLLFGAEVELSALYAYVSDEFGPRADLTEDFLGTGHAMTAELAGSIGDSRWDWFARFDGTESRTRFIAGVKWSL